MLALALLALALAQTDAAPQQPPAPPPASAPAPQAKPAPAPRPPRPPAPPRAGAGEGREEPVLKGFDRPSGKRFTGDFDEAEVDDALRQIAEAADWSIVFPGGEHGSISARFKNVPAEDALRAVLAQAGLTASREGAVITVRAPDAFGRIRLPGLSVDIQRRTEEAMRRAEREMERAERDMERAERSRERGNQNDKVIHGDVVVHADQPARDIVALRGSVKVEAGGEVRDVVAVLGGVVLEPGAHAREVVAIGGDVRLGAGAQIDHDVVSVGGEIVRDAGAEIGGEEVNVGIPALSSLAGLAGSKMLFGRQPNPVFTVAQTLAKFLVYFALGLLALALFPRRVDAVSASFTTHPWKSVFTGLLGVVVLPLLTILLVATIIGIPLVAVLGLLVLAAGVLGFTALAFHIGRSLPLELKRGTNALQLAIGTAIVVLVTAIPFLGGMAWVAAALLVFGAALRSRLGSQTPALATSIPPGAPPPPPPAAPAAPV
jgi:hypothetical protein